MVRFLRSTLLTLVACAALLPASAAGQSPSPVPTSPTPTDGGSADPSPVNPGPELRVVVAPTLAPTVDVYLDGGPLADLTDIATGAVSGYVPVATGAHSVDVFADGTDRLTSSALGSAVIDFGDTSVHTLAVRGDGSVLVLDDATIAPAAGASLRVVNLDTDAGPVDAWLGDTLLVAGLSPLVPSDRIAIAAGPGTLTTNAPGDRLSPFASDEVVFAEGTAMTAFMVPTDERAVWLLAIDATAQGVEPDASPSPGPGLSPSPGPDRSPSPSPAALEWRTLPVYECELRIAFQTDDEHPTTRQTGTADVRVPASLRDGLALYHSPVMPEHDPLTGWALGPDGWTCVRHLGGDFDTSVSGLTIRSAGAGRAAAPQCGPFGCDPAVGSDTGRFIAYGSTITGSSTSPAAVQYGVAGTAACAYNRRFRSADARECRGIRALPAGHGVPRHSADGSSWVDFTTSRGGDTVVSAVGAECARGSCVPHLIECKLRPEDRALCDTTLQVMLDPARVRVPRVAATLACPRSIALIREGNGGDPPGNYTRARVVRTLRGEHELVVDGVPVSSIYGGGNYPAICGGASDRVWYRVRRVDGKPVDGWIAKPLVRPVSP